MDFNKKGYSSMPSDYITIVDLKNGWLKQQQQKDDQQDEKEQTTHNPSNKDPVNCYDVKAKFNSQFHKPSPSNSPKNPNFISQNGHLHGNKLGKQFRAVEKASNSSQESSQINVATAEVQPNHISNNDDGGGKKERKNSQFRNRNAKVFRKKKNSSSESSQINVATVKVESNHISSKTEDEVGEKVTKNPQFQKNPNFKLRTTNYRKVKGEKRLKDSESNVAAAIVGNDDQKAEDEDKDVKETNKKKNKKGKNRKNKKKNKMTVVDDQTVEKKDSQDETEDLTVEKKDNRDGGGDRTVEKEGNRNGGEDQTAEEKGNQDEGDDQTVEKKDNQDEGEDQRVEIEGKMKEVNVSEENERSTAVIKEGRRVYGSYRRVDRREYGKGILDERSMAVSQGQREVYRGFAGVESRGSYHQRNFRREETLFDRNWGRSTAVNEGWRGVHRGYSGDENRGRSWSGTTMGELKWVKKNEEHP